MMPDYTDDFDNEDSGLIDEKAIRDILEKATDSLRSLGLTVKTDEVSLTVHQGQVFALIPALVRPSAKKKLVEDKESREAFNQMMAAENEQRIKSEAEKIRSTAMDPDELEKFLYGDDDDSDKCAHPPEQMREGLCLDCGEEI